MADQKISQLTELTVVDGTADELPIVDASATETKKVLPANLPISSATQTALDTKVDKNITWTEQTDNYTLVLTDKDKAIDITKATAVNVTVPPSSSVSFPAGAQIIIRQSGAGQVTIVPGSGVTIQSYNSRNKTTGQWAMVTLIKRDSFDEWALEGNLTT